MSLSGILREWMPVCSDGMLCFMVSVPERDESTGPVVTLTTLYEVMSSDLAMAMFE